MNNDIMHPGNNVEVITGSDNTTVMQARSTSGTGTLSGGGLGDWLNSL